MVEGGLDIECNNCWATCTEIKYHTEVTSLQIREQQIRELIKHHPKLNWSEARIKNASIIHIYLGVNSIFPRLRQQNSSLIELISSAGGLLGLCMGFSMLSLLEVLYHATIRVFCRAYSKRRDVVSSSKNVNLEQKINFSSHQQNHGYLTKMFHRNAILESQCKKQNESLFKISGGTEQKSLLPAHFRTPFETDFQRTYVATTWLPPQPNFMDNLDNF